MALEIEGAGRLRGVTGPELELPDGRPVVDGPEGVVRSAPAHCDKAELSLRPDGLAKSLFVLPLSGMLLWPDGHVSVADGCPRFLALDEAPGLPSPARAADSRQR